MGARFLVGMLLRIMDLLKAILVFPGRFTNVNPITIRPVFFTGIHLMMQVIKDHRDIERFSDYQNITDGVGFIIIFNHQPFPDCFIEPLVIFQESLNRLFLVIINPTDMEDNFIFRTQTKTVHNAGVIIQIGDGVRNDIFIRRV